MMEVVDGQYQKYVVAGGDYIREHFFGKYPELLELVKNYSDEKLAQASSRRPRSGKGLRRLPGRDSKQRDGRRSSSPRRSRATAWAKAGEGRNMTHKQKKLNEEELREFRTRFGIPISDERVAEAPFYRPPEDSPEMKYLREAPRSAGRLGSDAQSTHR